MALHLGEILRGFGRGGFRFRVALELVEGCGDDFLFALGDLLVLTAAASATTASACCDLREVVLEGNGLDEHHVRLLRVLSVTRDGVHADDVARNGFEIFHREQGRAIDLLRAFGFQQVDGFLRARR